jgi:hypothetical protein
MEDADLSFEEKIAYHKKILADMCREYKEYME